jgi:hypothetical protein
MTELTAGRRVQPDRGRMVLALIAGIPVMVILASTWLWYFVVRGDLDLVGALGTANRGNLLQPPRAIADLGLRDQSGESFAFPAGEAKWTLLIPQDGAVCAAACERRLYLTRQIHLAMGKEFNRLRRAWVGTVPVAETALAVPALSDGADAPAALDDYLRSQQAGLFTLQAPAAALAETFPEYAVAPDTWYLVDPAGWIMMSYNADVGYKDVIADLKFLLKNSNG